jgi:hypothetical protein
VAQLASPPPLAETQRTVLLAGGVRAGRLPMNLVTLASNAISMSVPAGVAVSGGYSFGRYRRFGAGAAVAAWAELAAGAIAFCALAGLALAGAVIAGGRAAPVVLPVFAVVFAGSATAAILFRYPARLLRWVDRARADGGRRCRPLARLTGSLSRSADSLAHVHPSAGAWTAAWTLSLLNWLLDAASLLLSFAAVHAPLPWGSALPAFAGAKVLTSIGLTPAGLGVAEGGLVATLVAYGAAGTGTGAAVLVYRVMSFVVFVGIGWLGVALLAVTDGGRQKRSAGPVPQ